MLDNVDLLIGGAGPVGCVLAERAATVLGWNVLLVERRPHLAGNCFDAPHANGVLVHRYGPHYFRTDDETLLHYLGCFTDWRPADYVVKSQVGGRLYPFPINRTTLEQFFGMPLDGPAAERLLAAKRLPIAEPCNSEEYVLSRVGRELYESFYLPYTLKQWGRHPRDLAPSVCGRVPVRTDRDERYVGQRFQVMPAQGFTALFGRMVAHPRVRVLLNEDFENIRRRCTPRHATVYTGPVDAYFGHRFGRLPYRSLSFDFVPMRKAFHQPCVQINYPDDSPFTRSVEVKHVTGQEHAETVVSYETPRATGEPYYPVPTDASQTLYGRYRALAERETLSQRVYFCGRLAQYRYFNTDEIIQEALRCFETMRLACARPWPSSRRPCAA